MQSFKQALKYPVVVVFFLLLAGLTLADMILPDKLRSELENRNLEQRPVFSLKTLWENEWTYDYGEYIRDQFIGRDEWVSAHSAMEIALGKLESGGVWYARDGYLLAKDSVLTNQKNLLELNTQMVAEFAARHSGTKVYAMLVPSPSSVLADKLRGNPPRVDEFALIGSFYSSVAAAGAVPVDLRGPFAEDEAAGRQIYYRTDHHWTTDGGALTAYRLFCEAAGREAVLPPESLLREVPGFYGTNFAKTKRPGTPAETLKYYDLPNTMDVYRSTGEVDEGVGIMDKAKFDGYDKYGAFMRGNNGYSVIKGNGQGSVLLIKDSYGNSLAPYLVENYATVAVMDLRDWAETDSVMAEAAFDEVLILYSYASFKDDTYVIRMGNDRQG